MKEKRKGGKREERIKGRNEVRIWEGGKEGAIRGGKKEKKENSYIIWKAC